MANKALFGGTVSILEKVLDFRSQRHNVILSNIVNADTPGFKSFDIVMDEEADRMLNQPEYREPYVVPKDV